MASKEQCDRYAAEMTQRFDEFVKWAIDNWPREDFPLLKSDFNQSRREIGQILGAKLGESDGSDEHDDNMSPSGSGRSGQYVDMNPMPWP